MILNSRVLAFLLAMVLSVGITILVSVFSVTSSVFLGFLFLGIFTITYMVVFISLETLVFREVKRVRNLIEKLKNKDFKDFKSGNSNIHSPMYEINKDIFFYASTKQKEIDELKRMEQFRREFIANVSHELKTPLFAAQGFVHTLLDGAVKDKAVRKKFLSKAAKSLDGLDVLVQDLLILSQIETGDIRMNFEYFDIGKLLNDIIDQFEDKANRKNISLELKLPKGNKDLNVYGDWQRIQQVVNNLISNAINYTNESGQVIVSIKPEDHFVTVMVKDSGIGIPEGDVSRIFERFYRVDKSRSRAKGGTGLGLAIVKHILEGHKTQIKVESEPNKGSVFSFRLPVEE